MTVTEWSELDLPDVTPKSLIVLRELYESETQTRQSLIDQTHLDSDTVSNALKELQAHDLVETQPNPNDPRAKQYTSTVLPKVWLIDPEQYHHPLRMSVHTDRGCGALKGAISQRDKPADEILVSITLQESREKEYQMCQKCKHGHSGGRKSELEQLLDEQRVVADD